MLLLKIDTNYFLIFFPGRLKSYGNAVICVVCHGQLRRDRYWFNKFQAPEEISCLCGEDEETTRHKEKQRLF